MAGISIQTKNTSYYGAIHNKKSSAGIVGVSIGRYVKNAQNKSGVSTKYTKTTTSQTEERQKKLAALERTAVTVSSDEKLTQEELAERLEANKKKNKQGVLSMLLYPKKYPKVLKLLKIKTSHELLKMSKSNCSK